MHVIAFMYNQVETHNMISFFLVASRAHCFDLTTLSCRYGGFSFGMPLPLDLQLDLRTVPKNRTLSKVNVPSAPPLFSFAIIT